MSAHRLQRLVVSPEQLVDRQLFLNPQQHHYLSRVLRLQAGDRLIAMTGQGQTWLVEFGQPTHLVEAMPTWNELAVVVILLAALPKGSGFDDVVRQCTELGVAQIVPVISDRTVLHPSSAKLERWRRIAQEAAEQSERQQVPEILAPQPFTQALSTIPGTQRYICAERGDSRHLLDCLQTTPLADSLSVAIGPEGGWTPPELAQAIAAGYQPVSLGQRILRAVTAPVMALSLIASVCETTARTNVLAADAAANLDEFGQY